MKKRTRPPADNPTTRATAKSIGRAVRTAASRTPWESKCLAQALAAALMLRWRQIPFVLTLGVAKTSNGTPASTPTHGSSPAIFS